MKIIPDSGNRNQLSFTALSDKQLLKSIYLSVLMALLLPPFIGGSLMGLVGFYPMPEFYLVFLSYAGIYVFIVCVGVLLQVPRWYHMIIELTQQDQNLARANAQRIFARLPLRLFLLLTVYSIFGALSADLSLEQMGVQEYTLRDHLHNQFGIIPVILITSFPIFFYFVDCVGRYLGPRGIYITAIPLWVKMLMLGIVTPLLIDTLLIGYYYNRTGFFQIETLLLWLSLLMLALGGTWLAWRSLKQSIAPFEILVSSSSNTVAESIEHKLVPLSLDELGILTAQVDKLLVHQKELSNKLKHERDFATALLNTAPMIVLLLDPRGYIKYVNPYFEQLSGYPLDEIKGKEWFASFLPAADQDRIRELFQHATHDESTRGNINAIITRNGECRDIEWYDQVMHDKDGTMSGLLAVGHDITHRKQVESALQKTSTLNEKIISESPIGLAIYDHTGQCIEGNASIAQMIGATQEQVLAQNYNNIESWKKGGLYDAANDCISRQERVRHEFNVVTTFGKHAFFDCLFVPFKLHDEQRLLLMLDDITARRESERSIQLQAKIIDQIHDSVISSDLDGFITNWNKGSERLFGYSSEEMLGKHISVIYPKEERAFLQNEVIVPLQENGEHETEVRMRRKNNDDFFAHLSLSLLYDEQGNSIGMIGYSMDITERKKAEEEIERIFELSLDLVGAGNLQGYFTKVNSSFKRILGYEDEEFLAKPFLEFVHEDDAERTKEALVKAIERDGDLNIVNRYLCKDGLYKWVEWNVLSVPKDNMFYATGRDITERKLSEAELDKYRYQLEELVEERTKKLQDTQNELVRKERLATLGQLTATVSHELRNPLGAMKSSLYVIEKKSDKKNEYVQKAIKLVDRNIDRCDHIIDELLDFTRITDLELHATQIDEWLESIIDEQTIPKNIQVEKDFTLKDVELSVDSNRLRRAVINVVENACHAMLDDNQQVKDKKNARLHIKTQENNERVEIVITDTGSGIANDVLEKIFEPLFSTKGFGVGLGMPTVKQIMEQHGGGIEINSEVDKGTSVTLWLPKSTASANSKRGAVA